MAESVELVTYASGAIGRIVELHGRYYAEHWGLGRDFEAKVALALGEFVDRFDPERDGMWFAQANGAAVGAIFIDGSGQDPTEARLRFFIVDPKMHGQGLGSRLLASALDFCRAKGYRSILLKTLDGLDAACHLYEKHGFVLRERGLYGVATGSRPITELTYVLDVAG